MTDQSYATDQSAGQLAAFRGTNAPPEPSSCGTNATLHGWRIYAESGLHRFDRRKSGMLTEKVSSWRSPGTPVSSYDCRSMQDVLPRDV